ncbi:alanine--tRNA ligase [Proteinivorax hydrogeniformans]|uniref:Alanine--tRNA ligase n=1 Tax=Proteinivorax hydrogeniformans TaxID=1826727 RepID=A0AAU8HRA8_9FIRM
MKTNEIRSKFLNFYENKGHDILKSAPLIPEKDPTLLLIGAGMAPFKDYFTGNKTRNNPKVATAQKCIRTGDIENVGVTARHHTFFEMLGNFSFGDYFKEKAITWSWEFLTGWLKLDKTNLYISVYYEDEEAYNIWKDKIGISPSKIIKLGKKDNFWEIGVGPCGPSSEIYYDQGEELGCKSADCKPGCECDRYLEIWNLVFTQFNKDEEGNYTPLATKNIDTGMGLERIAAVMQGVKTNYEIDAIMPIINKTESLSKQRYGQDAKVDVSLKVIADHIRAVSFMIADGVMPSNEGRGYVLRRLIRKAVRHGILLGIKGNFLADLMEVVEDIMGYHYVELTEKKDYIKKVISIEEERFAQTLEQGLDLLNGEIKKQKGSTFDGETAFKLYDTYGFPLDMTKEILKEHNLTVDESQFYKSLEEQRNRARKARQDEGSFGVENLSFLKEVPPTQFTGYASLDITSKLDVIFSEKESLKLANAGEQIKVILPQTPFYPEGGGQVGDKGEITTDTGVMTVTDTVKQGSHIIMLGKVNYGSISVGQKATAQVTSSVRVDTELNHTATHILHKALKQIIGNQVKQGGSYVDAQRLRFDFTHFEALTAQQIQEIEDKVNEIIDAGKDVMSEYKPLEQAKAEGAEALFGEKYEEDVRVVSIGDYSKELCGGTHVKNTLQLKLFKIVSESSVGSGLRRIEAITGKSAVNYYKEKEMVINEIAHELKCKPDNVDQKVKELNKTIKQLKDDLKTAQSKLAGSVIDDILAAGDKVGETEVYTAKLDVTNPGQLRDITDKVVANKGNAVVVVAAVIGGKVNFAAKATKQAVDSGVHCGKIIKHVASICSGGGGGKPDMAQAGGKDPSKVEQALREVLTVMEE